MKYDELAFLNEQLSGMLKSGIPLEAALRQLCEGMKRGKWRREFENLHTDLSQGIPLKQAIAKRDLPDLYKQLVEAGAQSNDLPAILTLLADYYRKTGFLWTRLQGLMVYPMIVIGAAIALSFCLLRVVQSLSEVTNLPQNLFQSGNSPTFPPPEFWLAGVFLPTILLVLAGLALATVLLTPSLRRYARWVLPGFKEGQLSNLAAALGLMLKGGCTLNESLSLMQRLEPSARIREDLARWRTCLSEGKPLATTHFKILPTLFLWLISSEGEDAALGFTRAAEIYHARAAEKAEAMLYSALPISVMAIAAMMVAQLISVVHLLANGFQLLWLLS